jgi:hypothetical protein
LKSIEPGAFQGKIISFPAKFIGWMNDHL